MAETYILTLSCVDHPGIVAAVSTSLARHGANILEAQQFDDLLTGRFFMRVEFALVGGASIAQLPLPGLCGDRIINIIPLVFIGTIHGGPETSHRWIDMHKIILDHGIGTTFVRCDQGHSKVAGIIILIHGVHKG